MKLATARRNELKIRRDQDEVRQGDGSHPYLFDIYLKEGRQLMQEQDYKNALQSLNKALEMKPGEHHALLVRSRCHLQMGRRLRALRDADSILDQNPSNPEALYAKAETLFQSGNYELALIYFHRGLKQEPESRHFRSGIEKAESAVLKFGGKSSRSRSSTADKVGKRKLRKIASQSRLRDHVVRVPPLSDRTSHMSWRMTPDDFRSEFSTPLTRITKKPGLSYFRSMRTQSEACSSELSSLQEAPYTSVDEKALHQILGELHTDQKYLHRLQHSPVLSKAEETVLAGVGINYLQKCGAYWDSLGPLPPPQPTRRKYRSTQNTPRSDITATPSLDSLYKKEVEPLKTAADINFRFTGYEQDNTLSVAMETDSQAPGSGSLLFPKPTMTSFRERPTATEKWNMSLLIVTELEAIAKLYSQGHWSECQVQAEACLNEVEATGDSDLPDKLSVMATLHSYLGNAAAAMGDYSKAEHHHLKDLYIGENDDLPDAVSRALGNLGRVYTSHRKFNQALDVLARKAPMCSDPREVAWVFLEIGTCFLALRHHDYARDCGKKVLSASGRSDMDIQQFQAHLLLGTANERLKNFEDAIRSYRAALVLAKERGDHMAEFAINRAINKVEKKMAFQGPQNPKRHHAEVDYPESVISESKWGSVSGRTATSSVNTNYQSLPELRDDAHNIQDNATHSEIDVDRATVFSVMKRLRDETDSFSVYPLSDYQELDETDLASSEDDNEEPPLLRRSSNTGRRTSITRRKSVLSKKSISFKLGKETNWYEDNEHQLDSSMSLTSISLKSRKERAALILQERSMKIKYKKLENDWSPPSIDPTRHITNINEFRIKHPDSLADSSDTFSRPATRADDINHTTEVENIVASEIAEALKYDNHFETLEADEDESHPVELYIEGDIMDQVTVSGDGDEDIPIDVDGQNDFLYPPDALSFSCPFDQEFSIHQEDLLMMTAEEDFQRTRLYMTENSGERVNEETPCQSIARNVSTACVSDETDIDSSLEVGEECSSSNLQLGNVPKDLGTNELQRKEIDDSATKEIRETTQGDDRSMSKVKPTSTSTKIAESGITESGKHAVGGEKKKTSRKIDYGDDSLHTNSNSNISNKSGFVISNKEQVENNITSDLTSKQQLGVKNDYEEHQQADDSGKSPRSKLPLFKSKFHNSFAKKSPWFEDEDQQGNNDERVVRKLTPRKPLFKSKYHDLFAQGRSRFENESIAKVGDQSDQPDYPGEPLFKSKYHELFKTKPEEKPSPVKYEPKLYLACKKFKDQKRNMDLQSENVEPQSQVFNKVTHTNESKDKMITRESSKNHLLPPEKVEKLDLSGITGDEKSGASPKSRSSSGRTLMKNESLLPALKDSPFNKPLRSPREKFPSKWNVLKEKLKIGSKAFDKKVPQVSKHNANDLRSGEPRKERKYVDHWLKLRGLSPRYQESGNSNVGLNDVPSFIQKRKILFRLSKKNDKIVFSPLHQSELEKNWKVIYMRIRKGDKTFTVPVATDVSEVLENIDPSEQLLKESGKQKSMKQRPRRNRKLYPIKLGQKQKFKLRMNSTTLRTVQEDKEYKVSPRTPRSKRSQPGPETQSTRHNVSSDKTGKRLLSSMFDDGDRRSISLRIRNAGPQEAKSHTGGPGADSTVIRVPRRQQVVYRQEERDGKTVLVPVVKEAAHKMVLVKVKQKDKTFILPLIVGKS